jgi:hypothetical protein
MTEATLFPLPEPVALPVLATRREEARVRKPLREQVQLVPRSLEYFQGPRGIHGVGGQWVRHRTSYRSDGCQMGNGLDTLHRFVECIVVAYVAPDDLNPATQMDEVTLVPGAEVVQDGYLDAFSVKLVSDVAADKTCPACNEDAELATCSVEHGHTPDRAKIATTVSQRM